MSSPPKKSGGWGSVFSSAVAGLESRLDTILADDSEASAKARAAAGEEAIQAKSLLPPSHARESRDASRTRVNDRLAGRLAKATAVKTPSQNVSQLPSRTASPAAVEDGKRSREGRRDELDLTTPEQDPGKPAATDQTTATDSAAAAADVPFHSSIPNPPISTESSTRPSVDLSPSDLPSSRQSSGMPNGTTTIHKSAAELEADLSQQREEMHIYLEKIDALQSKLTYLARHTVAAAKEANAETSPTTEDARLAEKDERIAMLMQEGEKLSKTELRQLQTIKKLRAKGMEDERDVAETRKKLERAEQAEKELKSKLRRAEVAERQASDKAKQITSIEKHVDELKVDRENAAELVRSLTIQLKEAKDNAEKDKGGESRIAALESELEDAQIERKLAESRAEADGRKVREELEGQKQRFDMRELELKNEISILESRVEALRSRAEEAVSSESGGGEGGEGNVKLLRQVETLQGQYALAKENWETIESSLTARLAALEKERDESQRREGDVRRRAREVGIKARKAEEEVETLSERVRGLEELLNGRVEELKGVQARFEQSEAALAEAKAELERERKVWEAELERRIDEERAKSSRAPATASERQMSLNKHDSPTTNGRKATYHSSDLRRPGSRMTSQDLSTLHTDILPPRPSSRRSANNPLAHQTSARTTPPVLSRQQSSFSLETATTNNNLASTPTIEIETSPFDELTETPGPTSPSPDRTIADLVSVTSTAPAAGPSVQLVERMSAAVRRLESEKAASKDELARLAAQRDSARDEVVSLMREVEAKRDAEGKVKGLEGEMKDVRGRYEACLEMLGEREEEVEELKQDVGELKRLYRDLVEEKMGK